jgi:hypothetical protein
MLKKFPMFKTFAGKVVILEMKTMGSFPHKVSVQTLQCCSLGKTQHVLLKYILKILNQIEVSNLFVRQRNLTRKSP